MITITPKKRPKKSVLRDDVPSKKGFVPIVNIPSNPSGPLTTGMTLTARPLEAPIAPPKVKIQGKHGSSDSDDAPPVLTSLQVASCGGDFLQPLLIPLDDSFQPAVGVYLVSAQTGAGKSVMCRALVDWANRVGVPANYIPMFEPRVPAFQNAAGGKVFQAAEAFMTDLAGVLDPSNKRPRILVLDSVTQPLKAFASELAYAHQPTYTGGSQPSDDGFLLKLKALTSPLNICVIVTINSTRIPYADALEASVEGIISVQDVASFTLKDRTAYSGREPKPISIPVDSVNRSLKSFGLSSYTNRGMGASTDAFSTRTGIYLYRPPFSSKQH